MIAEEVAHDGLGPVKTIFQGYQGRTAILVRLATERNGVGGLIEQGTNQIVQGRCMCDFFL